MLMNLRISHDELRKRRRTVVEELGQRKLDALVLFKPPSIFYLTNFAYVTTERPIALVLTSRNELAVFLPRLELEHAEETALIDRVEMYEEYPGLRPPMAIFAEVLKKMGLSKARIGVESDGYGRISGYEGPALSEVMPDAIMSNHANLVEYLRHCKSPEEIALIKESARWSNLAHRLLQTKVRAGSLEMEISISASQEASTAMIQTLGEGYEPRSWVMMGVTTGFRGQIGPNSAFPHAFMKNLKLRKGDNLITYARTFVWGYNSELERTMFVGEPSMEQKKYFDLVCRLQNTALEAIKPGHPCSEVDRAARAFYEDNGLTKYWRHHVGHSLGLEIHEAPYLDIGNEWVMKPGMVFSVEPGIFVPGLGGFRHSDTVLVTENGIEMLTYYPRDLESLICSD
jgi:Xaa-Pro dipeptidase